MHRAAYVYFDEDHLLVTSTKTLDRLRAPCEPSFRFVIDVEPIELGERILQRVGASEIGVIEEVFNTHLQRFFEFAGVSGWRQLEAKWWHIAIYEVSDNELEVMEFQKCPSGGYATDRKPFRIGVNAEELGRKIKATAESLDRSMYDEGGPSHV